MSTLFGEQILTPIKNSEDGWLVKGVKSRMRHVEMSPKPEESRLSGEDGDEEQEEEVLIEPQEPFQTVPIRIVSRSKKTN